MEAIEIRGGVFAPAAAWLAALDGTGYRIAFRPNDATPAVGGHLWLRLGHPSIAGDRDVVACVTVEAGVPARDAPREVVARLRARHERLRELNAPWSMLDHDAIVLAWLDGGPVAVVERLEAILRERRALGCEDDEVSELVEGLAYWRGAPGRPEPALSQSLLFHEPRGSVADHVAWWLLGAGYAAASGGTLLDVRGREMVGSACLGCLDEELARVRAEHAEVFEVPPAPLLFESWEAVAALARREEPEDEEDQPQED